MNRKRDQKQGKDPQAPSLTPVEREMVEERAAPRAAVIHEVIREQGEIELRRPLSALAWSGAAGGISMGFSMVAEGLLQSNLPNARWCSLISKLGYSFGFLVTILGRQQLFTENTLTVILPLLTRRDLKTLVSVLRLWIIVLVANLVGGCAFAWMVGHTEVFKPEVRAVFAELGSAAAAGGWTTIFLRGMFAGWVIATLVWLLPAFESSGASIIVAMTYLIALGGFSHVVADSVEVLYVVINLGAISWGAYFGQFLAPTLLGSIVGGVSLVAFFNHGQVITDDSTGDS